MKRTLADYKRQLDKARRQKINIQKYDVLPGKIVKCEKGLFQSIPAPYRQYMAEEKMVDTHIVTLNIHNNSIVLYISCFAERTVKKCINRIVKTVQTWLTFALPYSKKQCFPQSGTAIQIYFYLLPFTKHLPSKSGQIIDTIHANTALTTSCSSRYLGHNFNTNNTIVIYRHEEWMRAFIHETFHYLGFDFSGHPEADLASNQVFDILPNLPQNKNIDLRVYESYCDTWATVFLVLLATTEKQSWPQLLQQERQYSVGQCAKVLNHYGITLADFYQTNSPNRIKHYRENTAIISYYLLKSVAMFHLEDFIEHCNGDFRFNDGDNDSIKQYALFFKRIRNPEYEQMVNKMQLRKSKLGTSLRMTNLFVDD
jgi:hypothetical protein